MWAEDDDPKIQIRQIQEPLEGLLLGRTTVCIYAGNCAQTISIYPNGDVTPCHNMVNGQSVIFGNILHQSLQEIFHKPAYQFYREYTQLLPREWRKCRWFEICHGGCTYHRNLLIEGVPFERYIYWGSRRMIFEALEKKVRAFKHLSSSSN